MAQTIKKLLASRVYDKTAAQWKDGVFETHAKAVGTTNGNLQDILNAIPTDISTAVGTAKNELIGGAATEGNTLGKLHTLIQGIQTLLTSDDVTLDTVQEIADYIKANRDDLTLMGINKVNYDDIVNTLDTASSVEGKALDARQGKVLKDLIDTLTTNLINFTTSVPETYATKTELDQAQADMIATAMPVISETAPINPKDGQIWLLPMGTIEVES